MEILRLGTPVRLQINPDDQLISQSSMNSHGRALTDSCCQPGAEGHNADPGSHKDLKAALESSNQLFFTASCR